MTHAPNDNFQEIDLHRFRLFRWSPPGKEVEWKEKSIL